MVTEFIATDRRRRRIRRDRRHGLVDGVQHNHKGQACRDEGSFGEQCCADAVADREEVGRFLHTYGEGSAGTDRAAG